MRVAEVARAVTAVLKRMVRNDERKGSAQHKQEEWGVGTTTLRGGKEAEVI
jgi:hypothetical protein